MSFEHKELKQLKKNTSKKELLSSLLLVRKNVHVENSVLFLSDDNCFVLNDKTIRYLKDFLDTFKLHN